MKWTPLAAILLFLSTGTALADATLTKYPFLPSVVNSNDDRLCSIIRQAYVKRFKSKHIESAFTKITSNWRENLRLKNGFQESGIDWLTWEKSKDLPGGGSLFIADASPDSKSLFALHIRNHSWRGDIYTIYYLPRKSLSTLLKTLDESGNPEDFKIVYPVDYMRYGSTWTWWLNNIFSFEDKYYYIGELDTFNKNNGWRKVYSIDQSGEVAVACELEIYKPEKELIDNNHLRAYSGLLNTINNIYGRGQQPCSGTLNAHFRGRMAGQEASARTLLRPWTPSGRRHGSSHSISSIRGFLQDWGLGDIWNLREYQTLENQFAPAYREISRFYVDEFGMSREAANRMATTNVNGALSAYMIISSSYQEYRQAAQLQYLLNVSRGQTFDWRRFEGSAKQSESQNRGDGELRKRAAVLAIDSPDSLVQLFDTKPHKELRNAFGKTLLMYAAHMNNYNAVSTLVEHGVDVNQVTKKLPSAPHCSPIPSRLNRTALHYAAENASIEVIDLLVQAGANRDMEDSKGNDVDFYFSKNPRFSDPQKEKGIDFVLKQYHKEGGRISPSFNCQKANSRIEKATCSSKALSIYDRELGEAYSQVLSISKDPVYDKEDQVTWLKARKSECGNIENENAFTVCLIQRTRARTRYLHGRIKPQ